MSLARHEESAPCAGADEPGTHSFTRHALPVLKGTVHEYEPWLAGTDAIAPLAVRFVVKPRAVPSE